MDRNDLVSELTRQQSEIDELKERVRKLEGSIQATTEMLPPKTPLQGHPERYEWFEKRARIIGALLVLCLVAMIVLMVWGSYYRWQAWLAVAANVGTLIVLRKNVRDLRKQRERK